MSRLQTFPPGYEILGNYSSARRQLGNAVPSAIGELVGLEVRRQFYEQRVRRKLRLIPEPSRDIPPPAAVRAVPASFRLLTPDVTPHPGPGEGPGALARAKWSHEQNETTRDGIHAQA